ncbi:hypothetical protein LWE61_07370 [Sphingobium sufflavum]|uniref:hypothetical protein n=1 Tax=Sphingobium sufflavum TaxID=1129547 RepID=UPI001F45001B|nr:hypothetical protein [Sphingobium sufflavum]MCE7796380.1 hypothetical protein [Sphingobium sufflavum]
MSLRIVPVTNLETVGGSDPSDGWSTRIAKLIPAEALGLYGTAVAMVHETPYRVAALWVIALFCILLVFLIRSQATRDPRTGKPQYRAVLIAILSFVIWLVALGSATGTEPGALPVSPIPTLPGLEFVGPLAALLWGTIVPYVYTGER